MHSILVADADPEERCRIVDLLSEAGYHTVGTSTFQEATRLLRSMSPTLLIADHRMGPYNGLQLLMSGRHDHPRLTGWLITASENPSLAEEARHFGGAGLLARPIDSLRLLDVVAQRLAGMELRRFGRKPLNPGLTVDLAGQTARVVDVADAGLRLEMLEPLKVPLPASVKLSLPKLGLVCFARVVWVRSAISVFRCGAALVHADQSAAQTWGRLVQALPEK